MNVINKVPSIRFLKVPLIKKKGGTFLLGEDFQQILFLSLELIKVMKKRLIFSLENIVSILNMSLKNM